MRRLRRSIIGKWILLLCVAGLLFRVQPATDAMALAMATADAAWFGDSICHSDGEAPAKAPAQPIHDCELCPACHLAAVVGILPAPAFLPAVPIRMLAVVALLPDPTGPPPVPRGTATPRGPPQTSV